MSASPSSRPVAGSASPSAATSGSQWTEYKNADGRSYWAHSVTKQSVWEKPDELRTPFERAMAKTAWKQYTSKGRAYYVHGQTKETKWDLPAELQELKRQIEEDEERKKREEEEEEAEEEMRRIEGSARDGGDGNGALVRSGHNGDRDRDREPTPASDDEAELEEDLGPPPVVPLGGFPTLIDAERAFVYLLRKSRIDETHTWDVTMRKIITDPLYKALGSLAEKKTVWQRYQQDLIATRQTREREKLERLRPQVRKLFAAGGGRVKGYTTFKTAETMFAGNRVWTSLRVDDRRRLLDEYTAELRRAKADEEETLRKRNIAMVDELLRRLPITVSTRWREARELIITSPEFKDDEKLQLVEDVDIIILFEAYTHQLFREHEENVRKANQARLRRARKARDGFRALLSEMEAAGKLGARTKWKDFLPLVESRPEYNDLLGLPGSSPLELWQDAVDDIGESVHSAVTKIKAALQSRDSGGESAVSPEMSLEQFRQLVSELGVVIDDKQLGDALHQLLEDVAREKKRAERKRRHQMEDLRYAMRKAEPPIDLDGTYEDALTAMRKIAEFQTLDEEGRKETFERFVRRQKVSIATTGFLDRIEVLMVPVRLCRKSSRRPRRDRSAAAERVIVNAQPVRMALMDVIDGTENGSASEATEAIEEIDTESASVTVTAMDGIARIAMIVKGAIEMTVGQVSRMRMRIVHPVNDTAATSTSCHIPIETKTKIASLEMGMSRR